MNEFFPFTNAPIENETNCFMLHAVRSYLEDCISERQTLLHCVKHCMLTDLFFFE
jgi:hypothetical protein